MKKLYAIFFIGFIPYFLFAQNSDYDSQVQRDISNDSDTTEHIVERIRFGLGGNLNFAESLKIDGFYYDITGFLPNQFGSP